MPISTGATTPEPEAVKESRAAELPGSSIVTSTGDTVFGLTRVDLRERALPIRQGDLTRLLLAEPGLSPEDHDLLAAFGKFLGATFHSEFYDKLHELKELYAPLDPDSDFVPLAGCSRLLTEDSDELFLRPLSETLQRANFRELDLDVIREAISAPNEMGLTYVPDFSLFEHLSVWVRGYTRIARNHRSFVTRFRKRTIQLDAYQRMVVALKFKPGLDLGPLVRSDVLYLRMFKDVPHVDMEMHLPEQGTKPRMRWIDQAQIASPFAISIPTILLKLFLATALMSPAVWAGLIFGPISAGVNSFFGFHRAKQKHLLGMIHRLYYLTLANNASVLTRLIDTAEDEEYKEAMLAYFFLWRARGEQKALTMRALDKRIECFLREKTQVEINFEVADALEKLFRLRLVQRDSAGGLHALPLREALQSLDRIWDGQFRYT